MSKKKVLILLALVIIIILTLIICLLKMNKTVTCELSKDNYKAIVSKDKDYINFDYKYSFETIDDSVDKYDSMSSYIDFISKLEGIKYNINQDKNNMEYSIKIELDKVSKDNYKLLEIDKIIDLSNKEIKKYYEDLGYSCK